MGDLPNLKKIWQFQIFVNTGPHGAGNFKKLLLPQFSSNLSLTYENIAYRGGILAITLLGSWLSFKKLVTL